MNIETLRGLFRRGRAETPPFWISRPLRNSAEDAGLFLKRFGKGMDPYVRPFLSIALEKSFFRIQVEEGNIPFTLFSELISYLENKTRDASEDLIGKLGTDDPIVTNRIEFFTRRADLAADTIIELVPRSRLIPRDRAKIIKEKIKGLSEEMGEVRYVAEKTRASEHLKARWK